MTSYAATPADLQVGYLLVGVFVGFVGAGLIWFTRSAWSERMAKRAVATVTETPAARRERLAASAFDRSTAVSLVLAADVLEDARWSDFMDHTTAADRRLAPLADVVDLRGGRK